MPASEIVQLEVYKMNNKWIHSLFILKIVNYWYMYLLEVDENDINLLTQCQIKVNGSHIQLELYNQWDKDRGGYWV